MEIKESKQSEEEIEQKALIEFQTNQIQLWTDKAETYSKEKSKLEKLLNNTVLKFKKVSQKYFGSLVIPLKNIVELLSDYKNGRYTEIPKNTITASIIALLYFVVPTDIIPDWIISIGFLDDLAVVSHLLKQIQSDLDEYAKWKIENSNDE
ncbi:MAG: YkvA family protein [Tissierellales bacterium]|jgi:uncharacterized membrane protein YkvA (DUF1232 family)|nr:YkvA family protein [Tissierellales bacterium]